MNASDVITAINTVGFPIFCVLALGFWTYKKDNKESEERNRVNELLLNFSLNLAKNTDAITNLTEYIKKALEDKKNNEN